MERCGCWCAHTAAEPLLWFNLFVSVLVLQGGGVPAVGNGVYCLTAAALDLTSLTPFLPVCAYQPPLSQISRCQAEPSGITGGAARLHLRQQAQVRLWQSGSGSAHTLHRLSPANFAS